MVNHRESLGLMGYVFIVVRNNVSYKESHNYNRFDYNQSYLIMEANLVYTMERDNLIVYQIYGSLSLEPSNTIHLIAPPPQIITGQG
jgi:hypothetical protein